MGTKPRYYYEYLLKIVRLYFDTGPEQSLDNRIKA